MSKPGLNGPVSRGSVSKPGLKELGVSTVQKVLWVSQTIGYRRSVHPVEALLG